VRPDEARAALRDEGIHPRHVEDRDALRDRDDELDPGVRGLEDRVGRERGWNVDDGGVRAGLGDGAVHGIEDRHLHAVRSLERLPALAGCDTGDDGGAVLDHLPCVERAIPARDPLHDQPCAFVSKDRHDQPLAQAARPASSTAFWTTSSIDVEAPKPALWRISRASCSLVPVKRITIGIRMSIRRLASTMPLATSSQRVMPPKMLNRMTLTFGSCVMMRSALTPLSGFDEPPMSRKFAGSPPSNLIRSIVAMARRPPLTTAPISPSNLTYVSPAPRASVSAAGSAVTSRSSAISGRRKSSLSSMFILASIALTSPSGVVISGLISASEAPLSTNARYRLCRMAAQARCCAGWSYSVA